MLNDNLKDFITENYKDNSQEILSYMPSIKLDYSKIKAIMINEIVPSKPEEDFYSHTEEPYYMKTTKALFEKAGVNIENMDDILNYGIYITNAVKLPKTETTIKMTRIREFVPILEKEISLFPNLKVIMLMGDVAKKAFNVISKKESGKNTVPSISTYKLRNTEIYYKNIRVFPSYIMTGKNILIEKSKMEMAGEDIGKMMEIIK